MKQRGGTRKSYHHGDLRQALLEAAESELQENGVEGFTLRGCAKRAGVSHAAPAHHFRDADALLTALAGIGFERFIAAMKARRAKAAADAADRLIALGLGYVDFAVAEPALFRLMFSSDRPDFTDPSLNGAASSAFGVLVEAVGAASGGPGTSGAAMRDVAAAWSMVHGIAGLVLSDRMKFLPELAGAKREEALRDLIRRVLPARRSSRSGKRPPGGARQ